MGIEPTFLAWEANVLPLNYTRLKREFYSTPIRVRLIEITCRRKTGADQPDLTPVIRMSRGSRNLN
jgi:hypothetical protein